MIFTCKYRKKLLDVYGSQIKDIMLDIAREKDFNIITMEVDSNHIHLLVRYNPSTSIVKLVSLLKQISTYRIWRLENNSEELVKVFWKEKTFWSDGYFTCSIGKVSENVIKRYIEEQG